MPTVPLVSDVVVTCSVVTPEAMVIAREDVAVCGVVSESLTVTLKEDVPLAVGVPLIAPLVDSVNPAGKAPEAKLHV